VKYSFGETGLWAGGILLGWMLLGLFALAWRNRRGRFAPVRFALWVYLCAQMGWFLFKAYPVMENGTMTMLFWGSAGLLMALSRLDEPEGARSVSDGTVRRGAPSIDLRSPGHAPSEGAL
jgi:hypothetical protein